ncbi:uncharacterized protein BT62DRAFT_1010819 [Guyanagaster necrorhizus]|uniref:Uncharacterized protein n=1 Tax=Guyanagaster necrorhizus TaxID=856835 RepID=A0A9P7VK01_9AGAR|nr:uncharacterized protein BT62DRAFT_1010819 [Guyanagaster necrorhizus MCA 3950]KAG7442037.1 hypothetical protein BT62DRAFT_1010819 [Guyanagaster necrorhizus MCA 3950]
MNYLITQVAICAPSQKPTTFAVLEPLRDAAVDFLHPLVEAWKFMWSVMDFNSCILRDEPLSEWKSWFYAKLYASMRLNIQHARDVFPLLEATIDNAEAPLMTELRGSYIHELMLRMLKCFPCSSFMRVDLLDDLPQLISDLRSYSQGTMRCFNIAEGIVVRLHEFCSHKELVEEEREEIGKSLHNMSRYVMRIRRKSCDPLDLGLRGSKLCVRPDYMGRAC